MRAPARVLYLSYLGGLGGGETSLLSFIRVLNRSEFEPWIICGQPGAFVQELQANRINVRVIPFRLPRWKHGWVPDVSSEFFPKLWHFVRSNRIGLIHCNDLESAYYAAPLAKLLRIPILWTCGGWWSIAGGWKGWFYQNLVTRIITPTVNIRETLIAARSSLRHGKVVVIPFGVDIAEYHPGPRPTDFDDEFHLAAGTPVVTQLARFQEVKGHTYLLEAALEILERLPQTRFLLVGDNAFGTSAGDWYKQKVLRMLEVNKRLRSNVILAGFRRDVPRLLRGTDVLASPSLFESYGMAPLEAMACGVSVVSTNVGGPADTVLDNVTGFLVPPRDPKALADRILQLLTDPILRAQLGRNGRRRVEEHYSLQSSAARLEDLYRELLPRPAT